MSIKDVMERPLEGCCEPFQPEMIRRTLSKLQDERRDLDDQEKALRIALKNVDQCTRENFTKMQVLENLLTAFGLPIEAEEDTDILMAGLADMELHGIPDEQPWGLSRSEALEMLDQHQEHD